MMDRVKHVAAVVALSAGLLMVSACDRIADSTRSVQSVTYKAFNDSKSSWRDFLTYHPPVPDPLPQTRYCYQMQSDITCYDSQQASLTSKLVGFQDGEMISWVQPGGGSLGASGGEPVALRPVPKDDSQTSTRSINDFLPELSFSRPSTVAATVGAPPSAPTVAPNASQSAIDVSNLPPINSVAKVGDKVN